MRHMMVCINCAEREIFRELGPARGQHTRLGGTPFTVAAVALLWTSYRLSLLP